MLLKRLKITKEKEIDIDENKYYLNNKNIKSNNYIKYYIIILYINKENNIIKFN